MRPILFYMIGLPGAGKTTFAQRLSTLLEGEHLRGDQIGLELFRFPTYSLAERRMVQEEMCRRAIAALQKGRHTFYDAATNTHAQRQEVRDLAAAHGATAIGLWIETPIPLAKKRAATARDSGIVGQVVRIIPPHVFDQYAQMFESPQTHETIIRLSGDAPFYLQYRRL